MVDVLKSGYIQLIADSNYQAAKKKPAAEREVSSLEATSRIAATECIKGSATNDDGECKTDFVFLLTLFHHACLPPGDRALALAQIYFVYNA